MVVRTLDDEFLSLLCEDDELVRAEFDAIIEANWARAAAFPQHRADRSRTTPYQVVVHPHGQDRVPVDHGARQRSPPCRKAGDVWTR
jgi:hypothetical protein